MVRTKQTLFGAFVRRTPLIGAFIALVSAHTPVDEIDRVIDSLPDDEKIGQLLFVGFDGQVPGDELRILANKWHVGGIALYAPNMETPQQVRRLTGYIRSEGASLPAFIATDQEGGIVHRLRTGVPVMPSNMAIGATASPEIARRAGRAVGAGLRELGFTMNFAPVLDVLSAPQNDAIATRSFSDEPGLVGRLGSAFAEGEIHPSQSLVPIRVDLGHGPKLDELRHGVLVT